MSNEDPESADEEYFGRYGCAAFELYDAVEVIGDDGYPCRSGIVVRIHNSLMGWRYEVSMLQARAYVGLDNLRKLPSESHAQQPIDWGADKLRAVLGADTIALYLETKQPIGDADGE